MKYARFGFAIIVAVLVTPLTHADLLLLDPDDREKQLAEAEKHYAKRDVAGLHTLLRESHLHIKKDVALKLGRLGATEALDDLREYDRRYSRFACSATGEFRVAIILIENETSESEKKALLALATEPRDKAKHAHSVIDAAGRELSRFKGDDIAKALVDVYTYGAQYTVLFHECRKMPKADAIARCIAVLEAHETPLKAEAAEDLLIGFGKSAKSSVQALMDRADRRIGSKAATAKISQTIRYRCSKILKQIEANEKVDKTARPAGDADRPSR
jgi:hypothetical protein